MLSSSCGNYCLCTPTTACMLYCTSLLQHISFLAAATALYSISSSRWKSRGHMHTCSWITTNRVHGFWFPRTRIRECPRYYVIIVCFFVYSRMFESHLRPMGPTTRSSHTYLAGSRLTNLYPFSRMNDLCNNSSSLPGYHYYVPHVHHSGDDSLVLYCTV